MNHFLHRIAHGFVLAGAFAAIAGLALGAEPDSRTTPPSDPWCVPSAKYSTHMAAIELEFLHRLQINDAAHFRTELEKTVALDILSLWGAIQNEHTSIEDRKAAYGMLRLIAIQNEKFPVSAINDDPTATAILRSAIQEDTAHADLLRRQDWNKPKWVNWVN
jgi:hypothetical protein